MVWSLLVVALLSCAQLTFSREIFPSNNAIRNAFPRSDSEELEDESLISLPSPLLYALHQNARPSSDSEGPFVFQREDPYPGLLQERTPFLFLREPEPSSKEQVQAEEDLAELQNNDRESSLNGDDLSSQEKYLIQKRLKMKGFGLLGASKSKGLLGGGSSKGRSKGLLGSRRGLLGGGRQSLVGGFSSKSRPKGLVLSIDLGIKALRDAILHAKVKQKNKQHHVQAQKNMHLLHSIGKRDSQIQSSSDSFGDSSQLQMDQ